MVSGMSDLEQSLKKAIESGDLALPVLPTVSAEVISLTQNPDSDAKQLAQLIQSDQSLAGYVMRMANSAAFNSVGKIQTLQQAISKLGMRQVGQMALTISVGESVFKASVSTQQIVEYLWRHALASGLWSRELARTCKTNAEVAFMCGLLHQIGKPVIVHAVVQLNGGESELKEHKLMLDLVNRYHKIVGVNLARRWNLPDAVVEAINYIDDCYAAPSAKQEVGIVSCATKIADLTLSFESEQIFSEGLANIDGLHELNLYDEDIVSLQEKREQVISTIDEMAL